MSFIVFCWWWYNCTIPGKCCNLSFSYAIFVNLSVCRFYFLKTVILAVSRISLHKHVHVGMDICHC